VEYTFVPTVLAKNRFQSDPVERTVNLVTVVGRVDSVEVISADGAQIIQFLIKTEGTPAGFTQSWNLSSGWEHLQGSDSYAFPTKDGSPDVCGDPPGAGYPPEPPPTEQDVTVNIDITNSDGDVNTYSPTVNFDPSGTIVFPPVIDVGGIEIGFDIGGVTIDNSKSTPSGGNPALDEPVIDEEEEEEKETETEIKIVGVTIASTGNLDTFDSTAGNGAPDAYYIGWIEFQFEGFNYPRQFINFLQARFDAPEVVDDYAVTFRPGWTGTVTVLTEEVEVEIEEEPQ
jgi:hypothetical protein